MDRHSLDCLDFSRVRELLASHASCALGRELAMHIQPVTKLPLVQRWLAQVNELRALRELRGMPPFGGVSDIRPIVKRCVPPLTVTVEEIAQIGDTLRATHALGAHLGELPAEYPELRHLAERVGDFGLIADHIQRVIDERGQVRDDASPKLSRIRREIADSSAQITSAVDKLLTDPSVRRYLQFPNHTFHGDRMVLPVRTEYRGRVPGIVHRSSDSGATLYIEPAIAVELNNRISNLRSEEAEEIARLLWELAHEIHLNETAILRTVDTLAVIDLIAAKLRLGDTYEMRCPELEEGATLHVRHARHPLLIQLMRERAARGEAETYVVPIDYRIGDDFDLLIITGPNTGGKTVTLKTIGLLTLMVQAGLPVPVGEGSRMGIFGDVQIDIGDEQSMAQSLSTFSAHLTRQMEMLRKSGAQTLVLIDELGAGTDPDEGAAIGLAVLDDLLRLKARCIVTTHIGALKSFSLTRDRAENGCVEFDEETMRPTYKLRLGEPGLSNAIAIAERLGMPKRLVQASRDNLSHESRALHAAMQGTLSVKRQAEAARRAAENATLEAARERSLAESEKSKLKRQQSEFEQWVQRVVHLQPGDPVRVRDFDRDGKIVRVRIDQHRAEVDLGTMAIEVPLGDLLPPETPAPPPRPPRPPEQQQQRRPRREHGGPHGSGGRPRGPRPDGGGQGRQPHGSGEPRPPRPEPAVQPLSDSQIAALQQGDAVYVKRFHRDGRIVRVEPEKRVVVVNVGLLEVEAPFDGLGVSQPRPERGRRGPRTQA